MKQTSVEWLYEELILEGINVPKVFYDKAKEMEKEQIEEAYMVGYYNHSIKSIMNSEEYYEQNFNL